jgi:SAM-dependent methyltransferase
VVRSVAELLGAGLMGGVFAVSEPVGSGGVGPDANAVYALGSNPRESARLVRQSDELLADSTAVLDRVGLGLGGTAIDLGCGPRGCLELLAGRVGANGRVVGLDADPEHTAMAAEFVDRQGLRQVEIVTADARHTGLPSASFDCVLARTLLINVPDPVDVIREMARLAAPGGWVASLEPDAEYSMCYPPHPAFDRICEIFPAVAGRNGADVTIGRRVSELMRQASLEDVGVEAKVQTYAPGNSRRTNRLEIVQSMRTQVIDMGLATEDELDGLDAAVRAHLDDPRTIVIWGHLFMAWGRKPGK